MFGPAVDHVRAADASRHCFDAGSRNLLELGAVKLKREGSIATLAMALIHIR